MELITGGMRWRVDPEAPPGFKECVLEKFPGILESRACKKIKVTEGRRTIYSMVADINGATEKFFIKTYSRPGFFKRIKYIFRASRTRQEWKMSRIFNQLELPAARIFAMGEKRFLGLLTFDVLVQEYLEDYSPLDACLADTPRGAQREKLVNSISGLVARLHAKGILQRDFKPDSIMVKSKNKDFDIRLVDLERAKYLKRELRTSERINNLATLCYTSELVSAREDRKLFFRNYPAGAFRGARSMDAVCGSIEALSEHMARKWARGLRSWVRTKNELYYNFAHGGYRIYAHESMPSPELEKLVDGKGLYNGNEIKVLRKRERDASSLRVIECRPTFSLKAGGFVGGALFGFENATVLRHRGIPYIKPRAAVEKWAIGEWRTGYLLMEYQENLIDIQTAWESIKDFGDVKTSFLSRLGFFMGRLEKTGVRSLTRIDGIIKVLIKDEDKPEFFLARPELISIEKRGHSLPDDGKPEDAAAGLGLDKEEKDMLQDGFGKALAGNCR